MADVDEVIRELSDILDQLLALPDDAFAEKYRLQDRRDELRAQAAEFAQDWDADRPTVDLVAELEALIRHRKALVSSRTGFVTSKGGNAAPATAGAWVKLGKDALSGTGLDSVNVRIASLEALIARRASQ